VFIQNVSLKRLIAMAYEIPEHQQYLFSGPDWLDSEDYNIQARYPADTPHTQYQLMFQRLLEERFRMTLHREPKEFSVVALIRAKAKQEKLTSKPALRRLAERTNSERSTDTRLDFRSRWRCWLADCRGPISGWIVRCWISRGWRDVRSDARLGAGSGVDLCGASGTARVEAGAAQSEARRAGGGSCESGTDGKLGSYVPTLNRMTYLLFPVTWRTLQQAAPDFSLAAVPGTKTAGIMCTPYLAGR
jgi:hypothetical protein